MNGLSQFVCAAVLAGGLAAPALAASSGTGPMTGATPGVGTSGEAPSGNGQTTTGGEQPTVNTAAVGAGGANVMRKLRGDLANAGFTDIHIMPSSFLVRAKDSSGNPVMMLVNPDSVTAITGENNPASSAGPNSAGATPGPKSTGGSQPVTPGSQTKP